MEFLTQTERHMATDVEISLFTEGNRKAAALSVLRESFTRIARLERELSEFHPLSPVFLCNQSEPLTEIPATPALVELLELSRNLSQKTANAFDPLCKSGSSPFLGWDKARMVLWRNNRRTHLSFGAIGKGFVLDKVRLHLQQNGFENFLLNAGGSSIILSGFRDGKPWKFAWSWEKKGEEYLGQSFVHPGGELIALGVSGNLEQGEHILDPGKRAPAQGSLSALVAHPSAAVADALSTALFVKGWKELEGFQDPLEEQPMALVEKDHSLKWNGDFLRRWGMPC